MSRRSEKAAPWRLVSSAGTPLLGGAGATVFIAWSQHYWWTGPLTLLVVAAAVFLLCHW